MVTKTETINNQRFIINYSYDEQSRMTSMTYPSAKVIGYGYDDKGELMSISIDSVPFISDIKTNNNGLLSYTYADGSKHTRTYDENGNRLSQTQEENSSKTFDYLANSNILNSIQDSNGTDTKEISYEYDETGNIIKDDKHTYSYDGRNRLTAIDNNVTYQYNYDNKRVSKTVNGVKTYFIYDGHKLIGEKVITHLQFIIVQQIIKMLFLMQKK